MKTNQIDSTMVQNNNQNNICISSNRKSKGKRKWTQHENNAVFKHFRVYIQMKKFSSKFDIKKAKTREEYLRGRQWKDVKGFCYNEIKKRLKFGTLI